MSLSAYEALQQETPIYDRNSSDESEDDQTIEERTPSVQPIYTDLLNTQSESTYINSNFIPNDDNLIFNDKYAIFGLKQNQNLIIKGQFILEIQRGAVLINNVIYHSSAKPMKFMNPASNSLPLIQATQVQNVDKIDDTVNDENRHLFTSDYKSVIKVSSWGIGIDKLSDICPLLKNVFWNFKTNFSNEELRQLNDYELTFADYTFFPVFRPDNSITVLKLAKNPQWITLISKLDELYNSNHLLKILIIGGKNSGKSTLLKLILQNFLNSDHSTHLQPINYLDLDPGQTEFSKPDSISLSKHAINQFGNHLSLTAPYSIVDHYIGFTSPKDQPKRYNSLVSDLIQRYNKDGLLRNETLLINTPGWIKGYGLDLTNLLINQIKPTHLIYLNNNQIELDELKVFQKDIDFIPVLGNYQNTTSSGNLIKYSSAQLRMLKKLAYFHKIDQENYDFTPLINRAPLQLSYGLNGLKALMFWNEEYNNSLIESSDFTSIKNSVEGTIMALHIIHKNKLSKLSLQNTTNLPVVTQFQSLSSSDLDFKALALIHSVDEKNKLINLYIPPTEDLSKPQDWEYVLVRAKTETPIWEIFSKAMLKSFQKEEIPFITFDKPSELDKVWKVRKNVQRRGQTQ